MRWISCLLILAVCLGCSTQPSDYAQWLEENGNLKVLSTVGVVDELVRIVGGDQVDRALLIQGELDPHSYELVKGDGEKLAHADLVFSCGLGLEHGPNLQRFLQNEKKVCAIGNGIVGLHPESLIVIDGNVDPHIWMDVSLWSQGLQIVATRLAQSDPEHAELYFERAGQARADLLIVDEEMARQLAKVPENQRYLVTNHDAFNYFTRRYLASDAEIKDGSWQQRCTAPEGLAPESQLSIQDIKQVIDHLCVYKIEVLFPESNLSKRVIRKIVAAGNQRGLEVRIADCDLYADAMGPPGSSGDSYAKMMAHNASVISQYLRGDQ